ncbi:MAG: lipoprotein insertase outer membrane protein LolB [Burkholderiales bacterium]|nr:lipoprotein insertase outer membrane protein LolB [Burkholderiales bacterium]
MALLLISGCATGPRDGAAVSGRPDPDRFDLAGRLAVRQGTDGYSGSLRWQHADDHDKVELFAPVGTLYARLTRSPAGAVMEFSDGKRYEEADAQALSRRVLGWELPLEELRYWAFALPAPGQPPERFDRDAAGRPIRLDQAGWKVSYLAYDDVLPSRLDLEQGTLRVRLVVTRWQTVDAGH